jgi:hypothetical protein
MRRAFAFALVGGAVVVACASGEALTADNEPPAQAPVEDSGPGQTFDSGGGKPDTGGGGRDASLRDVDLSDVPRPTDGPLADVTFNPDAATGPGDCPTQNQLDFFLYYFEALDELSNNPNPESCPCQNTTLRCCFGGLVCVDR